MPCLRIARSEGQDADDRGFQKLSQCVCVWGDCLSGMGAGCFLLDVYRVGFFGIILRYFYWHDSKKEAVLFGTTSFFEYFEYRKQSTLVFFCCEL